MEIFENLLGMDRLWLISNKKIMCYSQVVNRNKNDQNLDFFEKKA